MAAPYLDQKTIDRIISDALNNGPNPAPSTYLNLTSVPKTTTATTSSSSSTNSKPSTGMTSSGSTSNSSHRSSTSTQQKPKKQWQKQCSEQENNQPTKKIESTIGETNSKAPRNDNTSIPVKKESPMSQLSHGKADVSMSTTTTTAATTKATLGNSPSDEMPLDLSTPKVTN